MKFCSINSFSFNLNGPTTPIGTTKKPTKQERYGTNGTNTAKEYKERNSEEWLGLGLGLELELGLKKVLA